MARETRVGLPKGGEIEPKEVARRHGLDGRGDEQAAQVAVIVASWRAYLQDATPIAEPAAAGSGRPNQGRKKRVRVTEVNETFIELISNARSVKPGR